MKRIIIDLQVLQTKEPSALSRDPLTGMIQALEAASDGAGVELHLLANSLLHPRNLILQRLFHRSDRAGRLHLFHGLDHTGGPAELQVWRRGVSGRIWDQVVRDISADLVVFPDFFKGHQDNVAFGCGAADMPAVLGFMRSGIAVDAGPSQFLSDAEHRGFLHALYARLGDTIPFVVANEDLAQELANYPMAPYPGAIRTAPDLENAQAAADCFAQLCIRAVQDTPAAVRSVPAHWAEHLAQLGAAEDQLITALKSLPVPKAGVPDADLAEAAQAVARSLAARQDARRLSYVSNTPLHWRLEGPFDSSYSLAVVNRETAMALKDHGVDLALKSSEGPGDFDPDPAFFATHPDLATLAARAEDVPPDQTDITSRNMFPPRAHDVQSPINLLHGYAWEETGFPRDFAQDINAHLQGLLVTSPHVKQVLAGAGIAPPIAVVGNGVDHLEIPPDPLPFALPQAGFRILHVSSCFPRKGADVLLQSYAQTFGKGDDVCLILKTHANSHNTVAEDVAALQAAHPELPPIHILFDDLTPAQMRSLYEAADLLVAPSRAEGFCLPVAEAILAGTPVLTTGWSGQMVFSDNPLVSLIDYRFSAAESHLDTWLSAWADPDVDHLGKLMRRAVNDEAPAPNSCLKSREMLLAEHSWKAVAARSVQAVSDLRGIAKIPPPRIGWVGTYNTRCGIATYSGHLIRNLPDEVQIFATKGRAPVDPDDARVTRCWVEGPHDTLRSLRWNILHSGVDLVVIQFNYGFFNIAHFAALVEGLKEAGKTVVIELHSTDDAPLPPGRKLADIRDVLARCDRLLVHGIHDMNRLKTLGLVENVVLFPHGLPKAGDISDRPAIANRVVTLGTYGFFLPQKGLNTLIDALALLRGLGHDVELNMVNAAYPVPESDAYIAQVQDQIDRLGLRDHVTLCTDFLPDHESFARLAASDLLVFAYGPTSESASGAARQALAVGRPVAVTPLPVFDDIGGLVHRLPGCEASDLAAGLADMVVVLREGDPEGRFAQRQARADAWRMAHGYDVLGERLWHILNGAHRDNQQSRD